MSAEIQTADIVIRAVISGVVETMRVTVPLALNSTTKLTKLITLAIYAKYNKGTAYEQIINNPGGCTVLALDEKIVDKFISVAKDNYKIKAEKNPFDLDPSDGVDVVIRNEDLGIAKRIMERLGTNVVNESQISSIANSDAMTNSDFKNLIGTDNKIFDRRNENLNIPQSPYVICDKNHPQKYVVVHSRILEREVGKPVVQHTYEIFNDGKSLEKFVDRQAGETWDHLKNKIVSKSGMEEGNLIYLKNEKLLSEYQEYHKELSENVKEISISDLKDFAKSPSKLRDIVEREISNNYGMKEKYPGSVKDELGAKIPPLENVKKKGLETSSIYTKVTAKSDNSKKGVKAFVKQWKKANKGKTIKMAKDLEKGVRR